MDEKIEKILRAAAWVAYCYDRGRSGEETEAAVSHLALALMEAEIPVYDPQEHSYFLNNQE